MDALLVENADEIAKLKAIVGPSMPAVDDQNNDDAIIDDIFLLRFVLSWKKRGGIEEAARSVIATLKWRAENAHKLRECRRLGEAENHDIFNRFQVTGPCGSLGGNEPILVIRIGMGSQKGLMNTLTHEQVVEYLTISKELRFMVCDTLVGLVLRA